MKDNEKFRRKNETDYTKYQRKDNFSIDFKRTNAMKYIVNIFLFYKNIKEQNNKSVLLASNLKKTD
jgi:hypothetical protein